MVFPMVFPLENLHFLWKMVPYRFAALDRGAVRVHHRQWPKLCDQEFSWLVLGDHMGLYNRYIQQIYHQGCPISSPIYNRYFPNYPIWVWINTYENTIFRGMNIHFNPAILMWTEGVLLVLTHCHMGLWSYWYGIYVTPISLISVI